jgi:hypothetical protein
MRWVLLKAKEIRTEFIPWIHAGIMLRTELVASLATSVAVSVKYLEVLNFRNLGTKSRQGVMPNTS